MLALKSHKLNAWLDGAALRAADSRIQITNIAWETEDKPLTDANAGQPGHRRGVRRENLKITIEFTLFEFASVSAREAAVMAANAWARSGYLEISNKPGYRVWVQCVQRANVREARDHNAAFTLTFEAAESPYWEDSEPTMAALSGLSATGSLVVPGTAECAPAEVTVRAAGATLYQLTLRLGDTEMAFTGLNIIAADPLTLRHDPDDGRLVIACRAGSRYQCRQGESADELVAPPGAAVIAFTADAECVVTFTVRGRYL